jgi:hypothetical protein
MATLVSKTLTNANITGSNNFLSVITTANALQNTGVTAATLTPTFVAMPNSFVGAGETLTAIGLEVGALGAITDVTITIRLRNTTDGINTDYTYNALYLIEAGGRGWNFFSLGAGQVLTAGKSWQIQISANISSRISLYRLGATVGDWNRIFVTNTNATYASGDSLYLGGRLGTIAEPQYAASTSFIMNSSITLANLFINNFATLRWTSNGLKLTITGNLFVFCNSVFTIGEAGSPVSGSIEFTNTTFGQNAFSVFGPCNFNIYGSDVSSNYNIDLASTANAGQANAVLTSAPDWINGQQVVYTSSRGTAASEIRTVNSVSGNTVTSTANFTNIHDVRTVGTYSQVQDTAKACLMDRGFTVGNTLSSTGSWFGSIYGPVYCNWDTVFFKDQGANVGTTGVVPSKYGWVVDIVQDGFFTVDNCSFYPSSQTNTCGIWSENNATRLATTYSITNCLMVSRTTTNGAFLFIKGVDSYTISGCITICTAANTGYAFITRNDNSASVDISNCFSYGFAAFINRTEAATNGVNIVTINNCFCIGTGFYFSANIYPTGSIFYLRNTTISNCIAINRISAGTAAVYFVGVTSVAHIINSCKFIGFNRYFYTTAPLQEQTTFNDCVFEDDTVASQNSILIGVGARPVTTFNNCYFSTTFANQSIIALSWSNLPLYSGGSLYFKSCSFNGNGDLFVTLTSLKYFAGFTATLESCLFRGSGSTLTRNYVKMGTATVSTDTFTGNGKSVILTPYSINEIEYPFKYQFLLPTTATNFTINFKVKSEGEQIAAFAYVENAFGRVATFYVGNDNISAWYSKSLSVTGLSAYTEALNLTIEILNSAGYLVIDDITVDSSDGIFGESGKYAFLNTTGGASETSNLFC